MEIPFEALKSDGFNSVRKFKAGIIGCGTIGTHLARVLVRDFRSQATLAYLCDRRPEKAESLKRRIHSPARIIPLEKLIRGSDLIIEAASAQISAEVAARALKLGKQVLMMSVGGLIDKNLGQMSKKSRGRLWIPSGALAGIDAVLAARQGRIRSVKLVTRKPPQALMRAAYFKSREFPKLRRREERRIFKGSAREAVKAFPENINVAAVLSLAGVGALKTRVEIWTSRAYRSNQHEVTVEGDFGTIHTVTRNVPFPENPKTSYLAALSAAATLKNIFSLLRVGT